MTWLDFDSPCFQVGNTTNGTGNGTSGNIYTWADNYNYSTGATVNVSIASTDLTYNDSYVIEWELEDTTASTVDYGNFSWTAYYTNSTENLTWTSLADGHYCLHADLNVDHGGGAMIWLEHDYTCFQVGNASNGTGNGISGNINAWIDSSYYSSGATVNAEIISSNLTINASYYQLWELEDSTGATAYGTSSWTANITTPPAESLSWSSLADGSYCLQADLYHNDSGALILLDSDSKCFQVGNETGGGESYEELNVWMTTTYLPWGDDVSVNMDSNNLTNGTNYTLQYALYTSTGVGVDSYHWNWYAYYNTSSESVSWANLAVGNYCLNATLNEVDSTGTMTALDEEQQCFVIYMPIYNEWINILTPGSTYDENISYHSNYASSDIVAINITVYDLDPTQVYNLTFDICMFDSSDNCISLANGDSGMAITPANNIFRIVNGSQTWNQNIVTFSEGCYVISSYLFNSNNATAVAMDLGLTFTVGHQSACEDYDGDGVNNSDDTFPADSSEWEDTDGDGMGNNADTDDDGDGLNDTSDAFPLDPLEGLDTDGDGIGNNADFDDDGDGIADTMDNCPYVPNSDQSDADGDGIGTACDGNENTGGNNTGNNTGDNNTGCPAGQVQCFTGECVTDIIHCPPPVPGDPPPGGDNNTGSGDDPTDDDDPPTGNSGGLPGFTSVFAALSLLGAAVLSRRRLEA